MTNQQISRAGIYIKKCARCNHSNVISRSNCEKCNAPLPTFYCPKCLNEVYRNEVKLPDKTVELWFCINCDKNIGNANYPGNALTKDAKDTLLGITSGYSTQKARSEIPWSGIGLMIVGILIFTIGLLMVTFTPVPNISSNLNDFINWANTMKTGGITELLGFFLFAIGSIWGLYAHSVTH